MLWQQRSSSIGSGRWWQILCQKGLTSGASINRRFYNTYADDYNTINSFAISPQPLFLISDTWHLMTTSCNGFENSGANRNSLKDCGKLSRNHRALQCMSCIWMSIIFCYVSGCMRANNQPVHHQPVEKKSKIFRNNFVILR